MTTTLSAIFAYLNPEADEYVSTVAIDAFPAGTKAVKANNGNYILGGRIVLTKNEVENGSMFEKTCSQVEVTCEGCTESAAPIDFDPALNASMVFNSDEFDAIVDAVSEQKTIALGDKYFFYHVGEKRWAKATMERTSSDIGRLLAGFVLPFTTTAKSKKNRLKKLNACYGLGLTDSEIAEIANA